MFRAPIVTANGIKTRNEIFQVKNGTWKGFNRDYRHLLEVAYAPVFIEVMKNLRIAVVNSLGLVWLAFKLNHLLYDLAPKPLGTLRPTMASSNFNSVSLWFLTGALRMRVPLAALLVIYLGSS